MIEIENTANAANFSTFLFCLDVPFRPAYSPDVYTMLHGMRADRVEYKFYEANMGYPELLVGDFVCLFVSFVFVKNR